MDLDEEFDKMYGDTGSAQEDADLDAEFEKAYGQEPSPVPAADDHSTPLPSKDGGEGEVVQMSHEKPGPRAVSTTGGNEEKVEQIAPNLFMKGNLLFDSENRTVKPGQFVVLSRKDGTSQLLSFNGANKNGKPVFEDVRGVSSLGADIAGRIDIGEDDFDTMLAGGKAKRSRSPLEQVRLGLVAETGDEEKYAPGFVGTARAVVDRMLPYAGRHSRDLSMEQLKHLANIHEGKLDGYAGKNDDERLGVAAADAGLDYIRPGETREAYSMRIRAEADEMLKKRSKAKERAGAELWQTEASAFDKIVKGGVESGGYALEFALPGGVFGKAGQVLGTGRKALRVVSALGSAVPVVAAESRSRYVENTTPEYGVDEHGELERYAAPDSESEAAYKAIGGAALDTAVEIGLESATMGLLRLVGKPAGMALGKMTPRAVKDLGERTFNRFMASETGAALRSINRARQDFTSLTQINSPFGELMEENVQAFEKVLNLDGKTSEYKGFEKELKDYWDRQADWDTQWDIFYGLVAQLAIGAAKSTSDGLASRAATADARRDVRMALARSGISEGAINSLTTKQQKVLTEMWRRYSADPDALKDRAKNLGISMRTAVDELTSREGIDMARSLEQRGIAPEKFAVQVGVDGKPAFHRMNRFASNGKSVPMNAMVDEGHGVTIVDQGDGTFYVMNDQRGFTARMADGFAAAKQLADNEVMDNQRRDADNEKKAQYLANLAQGMYKGRDIKVVPTEAALRWGLASAFKNGETPFGLVDAAQVFDADGRLKQQGAGGFHTPDGTVVVILDNVASPSEMERVLAHEATGHEGVESNTGRGENTVEFIRNAKADGFERYKAGERARYVSALVRSGMGEEAANAVADEAMSTDSYQKEAMARYAQGRLHRPTWYERKKHEANEKRRADGESVPFDQADMEVMLAKAEEEGRSPGGKFDIGNADSGVRYFETEQEAADETGNVRDEAPAQPEQGAPEPAGGEAARPVEAQPQGGEAPRHGAVEPAKTGSDAAEAPTEAPPPMRTEHDFLRVMHDNQKPVRVPVGEIALPDTQFKEGADPKTGVVKGQELKGEYFESAENAVVVYVRKDGTKELVTGRHRFDLAKRNGKNDILARVFRESDGYTPEDMRNLDAISNIIDEKGTEHDYIRYFDSAKPTRAEAESAGFLSRPKGRNAYELYEGATEGTRAAIDWSGSGADGLISPEQAGIIAKAAPRDAHPRNGAVQRILVKKAQDGLRGDRLAIVARSLAEEAKRRKAPAADGETQLDLFTSEEDLALLALEEKRAAKRVEKANEYGRVASVLQTAMQKGGRLDLNKAYARELGIKNPKDRKQLADARQKALEKADYWRNAVRLDEADKAALDAELGIAPKENLELESVTGDQIAEENRKRAEKEEIERRKAAPLKGGAGEVGQSLMDLGGAEGEDLFNRTQRQEPVAEKSAEPARPVKVAQATAPKAETAVFTGKDGTKEPIEGYVAPREGDIAPKREVVVQHDTGGEINARQKILGTVKSIGGDRVTVGYRDPWGNEQADTFSRSEIVGVKPLPQTRENGPVSAPKEAEATTPPRAAKPAEGRKSADTAVVKESLTTETTTKPVWSGKTPEDSTIVSGDEVRKTMPGYNRLDWSTHVDRTGYVGPRLEAQFQRLLKERKGKGNGTVVFLAGGNGAGKSTSVSAAELRNADFVIDSTLGNLDVAKRQIDAILANGQTPVIHFVYRTPGQALEGIAQRVKNGGHIVSPLSFANSHVKSRENLRLLSDAYGDKIQLRIYDNSVEGAPEITLKQLEAKGKPDHARIRESANYFLGHLRDRETAISGNKGGVAGGGAKGARGQVDGAVPASEADRQAEPSPKPLKTPVGREDAAGRGKMRPSAETRSRAVSVASDGATWRDASGKERKWPGFVPPSALPPKEGLYVAVQSGDGAVLIGKVAKVTEGGVELQPQDDEAARTFPLNAVVGVRDPAATAKRRSVARPAGEVDFYTPGLYTGSAADYERPSLHYVGTGEGNQVYGWGLYASDRRGVAEGYANSDAKRRASTPDEMWPKYKGKFDSELEHDPVRTFALKYVAREGSVDAAIQFLRTDDWTERAAPKAREAAEWLEKNRDDVTPPQTPSEHLYEQTWFTDRAPGDESHLLKWYEPVSEEQKAWIEEQAKKEGFVVGYSIRGEKYIAGPNVGGLANSESGIIPEYWQTGEDAYRAIGRLLGSPKAASEFLARAGIDGVKYPVNSYGKAVKDGDEAGWNYVSFRDDNIRVDHKWTDGEIQFDTPELSPEGRREHDEVVARYTNADGTKKPGWMKAPNGKPTKLTERQWAQVRTPSFKKWFGDWEGAATLSAIESLSPVEVADLADGFDVKAAYAALEDGRNVYDGRRVRFVNSTLGKILRHRGYDTARVVPHLKEVFDAAVPIGFEAEREMPNREDGRPHKTHRNFVGYHSYLGKIADGGKSYFVRFTVQELKTRSKTFVPNEVHSTFVSDVELYNEADLLALDTAKGAGKVGAVDFVDGIVAKRLADFKGARETSSKVVDENGEPLVVYHSTDADFTQFDRAKLGSSTDRNGGNADMARIGFWFNDRDLSDTIVTDRSKTKAVFLNLMSPARTTFEELYDGFRDDGADGYIVKDTELGGMSYVALHPTQVKSATGNNGDFSRTNPDINFDSPELDPMRRAEEVNTYARRYYERHKALHALEHPTRESVMDAAEGRWQKFRRALQDKNLVIREVEERLGVTDKKRSVYYAKDREFGLNEHQLGELQRRRVEPIFDALADVGVGQEAFDLYLIARHAPYRNALVRGRTGAENGSGMSDADADAVIGRFRALGVEGELARIADMVYDMNDEALQRLVDSGRLSQEDADGFRAAQADYVPLRTDMEDADRDAFNTSTSGWKKNEFHAAKGRDTLADSPLAWSIVQAERAIKASNANVTRQVAAALVRHAEKIGKPIGEIVPAHRFNKRWAFDIGGEVWTADALKDRPDLIFFKEDGRLKAIKIDGGKNALGITFAKAVTDKDLVQFSKWFEWVPKLTRAMSAMRTQYVPTFILRNMKADTLEAMLNVFSERGLRPGLSFGKRLLASEWKNRKDVKDYFRTGEARGWMKEFVENGGLTGGGMAAEGFSEAAKRIQKTLRKHGGGARGLAAAVPDAISLLNACAEYNTRLGIYAVLREEGVGVEDAISYARDATVNFNRKGYLTPYTNAAFMFSNAAIQGMSRAFKSMGAKHGKGTLAALFMVGVIQTLLDHWLGDDDDREKKGLSNAKNMTEHDKQTSLGVPLPGGRRLKAQIRNPWALPVYLGRKTAELAMGAVSAARAAKDVSSAVGGFITEPVGGNGFDSISQTWQTFAPTLADPLVQWMTGTDFKGDERLRKKWDDNLPSSWNGRRNTAAPYKWIAQGLNALSGGGEFRKGAFDTSPENWQLLAETVLGGALTDLNRVASAVADAWDAAQGAKPDQVLRDVPFVRDTVTNMPDVSRRYYESFDAYDADRTEFRGVKGADGRLAFAARHPWVMDDRVKRLDKEIRELGKMEQGLEKKGGEWVAAERTPRERLEFRRKRLAKMAEFVGIMEEKPSGRLPPDAEYRILTQAFSDAKKEYETIQKDPLLDKKHKKSILDEMRVSNPLLVDKVRWDVEDEIKEVKKSESELKKMREDGTPEKDLKDEETNLKNLKDNVLKLIRENRRAK